MGNFSRLTKGCLAMAGIGIGSVWASPAQAGQWVRATTAASEDLAMDYIGQRTIAVGGYGLTSNESDALWVLGDCTDQNQCDTHATQTKPGTPNNHYMHVWVPGEPGYWSNLGQTAYGAARALGGGSPYDFPYVVPVSGAVYGWNGNGGWYEYLGAGTADPNGFVQETSFLGNLYFAQAGLQCPGGQGTPCIDEYNVFDQSWLANPISREDGAGSANLDVYLTQLLPAQGPYRVAIDEYEYDGRNQLKLNWDNYLGEFGVFRNGSLAYSTDRGSTFTSCPQPHDEQPVLVDMCGFNGTYYGIEISNDSQNNLSHTISTSSSSPACNWGNLPCTPGPSSPFCIWASSVGAWIDTTPVNAIACDSSNGTLYTSQNQPDPDGTPHFRVFKWVP
jgi:hypothetical protein